MSQFARLASLDGLDIEVQINDEAIDHVKAALALDASNTGTRNAPVAAYRAKGDTAHSLDDVARVLAQAMYGSINAGMPLLRTGRPWEFHPMTPIIAARSMRLQSPGIKRPPASRCRVFSVANYFAAKCAPGVGEVSR